MSYYDNDYSKVVGKIVKNILLSDDKESLHINFTDYTACLFQTEGDCCSHTWIEHISGVQQVLGRKVLSIEDIKMPESTLVEGEHDDDDERIEYYGLRINTDFGALVIDYRNASNGYYSGWMNFSILPSVETTFAYINEDV